MHKKHLELKNALDNNAYHLPIYISSTAENELQQGHIYGIIHHPFEVIKKTLTSAKNWCEITPQHLNIKACTYYEMNNHCHLTFYTGRKYYEEPDSTFKLEYNYSVILQQDNYFHTQLDAENGPLGTYNYKLFVKAIPIDEHSSFIHFSYSYQQGLLANIAMSTYLSTIGRNKIGFTITGSDQQNQPVYIDGIRGVIERNVVRYYFAIQSYLDNLAIAADKQFPTRIDNWFDLTEKYPQQLNEMDKKDYIKYKLAERANQLGLQDALNKDSEQCGTLDLVPTEQQY